MSSTIETPSIITTEITQTAPYKVVIHSPPVIKASIADGARQGPSGANGSHQDACEVVTSVDGAQTLTAPVDFFSLGHSLFINGLRQAGNSYTTTGRSVVLPSDLGIQAQDLLTFEFYPLS